MGEGRCDRTRGVSLASSKTTSCAGYAFSGAFLPNFKIARKFAINFERELLTFPHVSEFRNFASHANFTVESQSQRCCERETLNSAVTLVFSNFFKKSLETRKFSHVMEPWFVVY